MIDGFFIWCRELGTLLNTKTYILFITIKLVILTCELKSLGDWSDVGTPGYISNPVVKDVSADGTWRATSWESRSLPRGFFLFYKPQS